MDAMKINNLPLFSGRTKQPGNFRIIVFAVFSLLIVAPFSCTDKNRQQPDPVEMDWDFSPGHEGWSGDFAEFPVGEEEMYELLFEVDTLPRPLDQNQQALKLSGNNINGDLFMFAKKRITGLEPNTVYFTTFTIEFATNLTGDSTTHNGPGNLIYLAAGASLEEPLKVNGESNLYEMNIGKCTLSENGENMIVLSDFVNGDSQPVYVLKSVENENPFRSVTNDKGDMWVIIGIDSAFPATATAYINSVKIKLF